MNYLFSYRILVLRFEHTSFIFLIIITYLLFAMSKYKKINHKIIIVVSIGLLVIGLADFFIMFSNNVIL